MWVHTSSIKMNRLTMSISRARYVLFVVIQVVGIWISRPNAQPRRRLGSNTLKICWKAFFRKIAIRWLEISTNIRPCHFEANLLACANLTTLNIILTTLLAPMHQRVGVDWVRKILARTTLKVCTTHDKLAISTMYVLTLIFTQTKGI